MQMQRPFAVITPTLDGDVLSVLAGADVAFTPGQVARLLPDASVEGIRKVLQRLTRQGLVLAQQVGRAYTYRLNEDHLAASAVLELAAQRSTLLTRLEHALHRWPLQPTYAALFGSAARGDMQPESDIDVFVVRPDDVDTAVWESLTGQLGAAVTRWTGNDTRVLDMTEGEVRASAASGDPVLRSIVDDGLTVAGHPNWLRRTLRAAVSR